MNMIWQRNTASGHSSWKLKYSEISLFHDSHSFTIHDNGTSFRPTTAITGKEHALSQLKLMRISCPWPTTLEATFSETSHLIAFTTTAAPLTLPSTSLHVPAQVSYPSK